MEDVDGELIVVQSVGDLSCRGDDRVRLLGGQLAEIFVHLRARGFQQGHGPDLVAVQAAERDREVLHRPLGLGPPQGLGRDPDLAHRVVLDPELAVVGHVAPFLTGIWRV